MISTVEAIEICENEDGEQLAEDGERNLPSFSTRLRSATIINEKHSFNSPLPISAAFPSETRHNFGRITKTIRNIPTGVQSKPDTHSPPKNIRAHGRPYINHIIEFKQVLIRAGPRSKTGRGNPGGGTIARTYPPTEFN